MKILKFLLTITLVSVIFLSFSDQTSAKEHKFKGEISGEVIDTTSYLLPSKTPEIQNVTPSSYIEERRRLVSTSKVTKKPIGFASNQPSRGIVFENGRGTIYWSEGGSSVSVSLGANFGGASVSVTVGRIASGVTGYGISVPKNTPVKLYIYKDLTIRKYEVDYIWYGVRGTKIEYRAEPTRVYLEARRL